MVNNNIRMMIHQRTNTSTNHTSSTTSISDTSRSNSNNGMKRSLLLSSVSSSSSSLAPPATTTPSDFISTTATAGTNRRRCIRLRYIITLITLLIGIIEMNYYYTNHISLRIMKDNHILYSNNSSNSNNNINDKETQYHWYDIIFHRMNRNDNNHELDDSYHSHQRWGHQHRIKEHEIMKHNAQQDQNIFHNENHTITIDDLKDIIIITTNIPSINDTTSTSSIIVTDEMIQERQPIIDILNRTGLQIDTSVIPYLPKWEHVTKLYGTKPVIYGLDQCIQYQTLYPNIEQRYIGVAGQMNTGTNALTKYLMNNIQFVKHSNNNHKSSNNGGDSESTTTNNNNNTSNNNRNNNGILWTVPWYKHSWISLYDTYHYKTKQIPNNIQHQQVMAIILIRDPYFWMQSMCESPYSLEWQRNKTHCPNLVEERPLVFPSSSNLPTNGSQVRIRWGPTGNYIRTWSSLVEMYNDWYNEYVINAYNISRLIIRFEDLLFHTEEVIDTIRECVGATWVHTKNETSINTIQLKNGTIVYKHVIKEQPIFQYPISPSKTHPYFTKYKPPSSLISAIIKYGQDTTTSLTTTTTTTNEQATVPNQQQKLQQPRSHRLGNMSPDDIQYAIQNLDPKLLQLFNYQINPLNNV